MTKGPAMTDPMHGSARHSAPDYTTAALVMGLVNLLWIFLALWAAFGFGAVVLAGYATFLGIEALRRHRRRA